MAFGDLLNDPSVDNVVGQWNTGPHTITFTSTPSAGNLLAVEYRASGTHTTPAGWSVAGSSLHDALWRTTLYYKISDGTETSVSLNTSDSQGYWASYFEFDKGTEEFDPSPLDDFVEETVTPDTLGTLNVGSVASTTSNSIIMFAASHISSAAMTNAIDSGFTIDVNNFGNSNHGASFFGHKVLSATATESPTITWGISIESTGVLAAFRSVNPNRPRVVARHDNLSSYGDGDITPTLVGTGSNRGILVVGSGRSGSASDGFLTVSIGAEQAEILGDVIADGGTQDNFVSFALFKEAQHPGAGAATISIDWSTSAQAAYVVYELENMPQNGTIHTLISQTETTDIPDGHVFTNNIAGHADKLAIGWWSAGATSASDYSTAISGNLANLQASENATTHLFTADMASVADADEDAVFTLTHNSGTTPNQGTSGVIVFESLSFTPAKPAGITGLNTSHPLYANIHKFYEFGQLDKELVGDTALTIGGAAVTNDADIGSCRLFTDSSTITESFIAPQQASYLLIFKGAGTRNNGDLSKFTFFDSGTGGNRLRSWYDGYNGGDIHTVYRGDFGTNRELEENIFASDGEYATGNAFVGTSSDTAVMNMSLNGSDLAASDSQTSSAYNSAPSCDLLNDIGTEGSMYLAAIVIFDKVLSQAERESITTTPWGLVTASGPGNQDPVLDTTEPNFSIVQIDSGVVGTVAGNMSDPDSDPLTYSIVSGAPAGITMAANGEISSNGNVAPGVYTINYQGDDLQGGTPATDSFDLTVTNAILDIDGDDTIYPGQTDIAINIQNAPATVSDFQSVTIGGEAMTNLRWNNGTPLVDNPGNKTLGAGQQLVVIYIP